MPFVSYSTSSSSVCVNRNENITFHKQFLFEAINMHFKSLFKIIENAFQYGIGSAPGSTTKKELIIGKKMHFESQSDGLMYSAEIRLDFSSKYTSDIVAFVK